MDFQISHKAEELRFPFRAWIEQNLPGEWRDVLAGSVDDDTYVAMRREWGQLLFQGEWSAPTWPKEYGGLGLSVDEQVVYLEELVRVGAPEPLNSNPIGVLGPCLMRYGTQDQRREYLHSMVSHEAIGCQGFSEPDAGSDLVSLRTRAEPTTNGFLLTGQKVWTTNAQASDFCYILARTDANAPKAKGITLMILDMHQSGVTVRPLRNISGTAEFNEVFLDEAFVPFENVVGPINEGWKVAMYALSEERTTGIVQRALRLRRDLENLERLDHDLRTGGQGAANESWQSEVVSVRISARVVEATILRNLALIAQGEDLGILSPMVIMTWSLTHQRVRQLAFERMGLDAMRGVAPYKAWLQSMLFSRGATIAGGTTQIQLNNIARGLGLPSATVKGK